MYTTTVLDPNELPPFLTPKELAHLMRTTTGALTQDRYLRRGVPFIKCGRRILYAAVDVADFIERSRRGGVEGANND